MGTWALGDYLLGGATVAQQLLPGGVARLGAARDRDVLHAALKPLVLAQAIRQLRRRVTQEGLVREQLQGTDVAYITD